MYWGSYQRTERDAGPVGSSGRATFAGYARQHDRRSVRINTTRGLFTCTGWNEHVSCLANINVTCHIHEGSAVTNTTDQEALLTKFEGTVNRTYIGAFELSCIWYIQGALGSWRSLREIIQWYISFLVYEPAEGGSAGCRVLAQLWEVNYRWVAVHATKWEHAQRI